jgi:hypothetical protein
METTENTMKTQRKILIDERNQFMRIAMAKLKPDYPFYPQRIAVAAAMYRRWYDRHN